MFSGAEDNHEKILDLERTVLELKAQIDAAKHAPFGSKCTSASLPRNGKSRDRRYELSGD